MQLPWIRFVVAPVERETPRLLPEMIFRAATVVPPTVLLGAEIATPEVLGTAAVPTGFVPMKLPATTFPVAALTIEMPVELPEIRLRVPAVVPPMVLPGAPEIDMPAVLFSAAVPDALVPIKLPATTFPLALEF